MKKGKEDVEERGMLIGKRRREIKEEEERGKEKEKIKRKDKKRKVG